MRWAAVLIWAGWTAAWAQTADPVGAGRKRFEVRCAGCHGADGHGGERAPGIGDIDRDRLRTDESVRAIIRDGIPAAGMPGFRMVGDDEMALLVAFVRSRVEPAAMAKIGGDAKAGERFFFGKGGCAACHMIRGRGGLMGPDLTDAGTRLTLGEIETALKNPGELKQEGYQTAAVELKDGSKLRGLIKNESNFDLQLQGFDGRLYLLTADQYVSVRPDPAPLMPALHAAAADVENLLAFVAHLPAAAADISPAESKPLPDAVPWERVIEPKRGEWPTYHGVTGGNRYTALDEITKENVARLRPKWIFPIPAGRSLEMTPVVVGGVMYATAVNSVYALDARNGRLIWRFSRPPSKGLVGDASSGINRGVAVLGDRVFLVTDNAHLLALHRVTGALLWDVEMADSRHHYGATSAPLVVGNLVISGVSGGDEGIRGFLAAYKAETGERAWRFWTVPAPGEPLARTWEGRALEHGCASTWLTGTFDPATKLLFWPTGNPCPDFNGAERKGDNLYSDSVLALDPETGTLKWYFQFTPHDLHDWDATETPMVVDAEYHGQRRKLLLQGNRNGFFYVLDRTNGKFLAATPFVRNLTWAKRIGAGGRPILAEGWQPTAEGTRICPSMDGASNWMSASFNPGTGLFYLIALEKCNIFSKNDEWWKQGESFYGGSAREDRTVRPRKYLRAIDPQTGRIVWEYEQKGPGESWAGLLTTATGLVIFGDDDGAMTAVDAATGKPLWHFNLNQHLHASPMSYELDGRQYIGMAAGSSVVVFAL
jgi:PQQ-dependent dehydrogenase (methanol/ethanol family)